MQVLFEARGVRSLRISGIGGCELPDGSGY